MGNMIEHQLSCGGGSSRSADTNRCARRYDILYTWNYFFFYNKQTADHETCGKLYSLCIILQLLSCLNLYIVFTVMHVCQGIKPVKDTHTFTFFGEIVFK